MKSESYINRFTTIPVLFDLIRRKRLVLMDPELWEDKNDTELMHEYKRRRQVKNLFALCFCSGGETIHHWNTFAGTVFGCCIEFDLARLTSILDKLKQDGVRYDYVDYRTIKEIKGTVDDLAVPFKKRWPYQCEKEFRIIWEGRTNKWCYEIPIDLRMIRRITVSQKMPPDVFRALRKSIRTLLRRPKMKVSHSTIYRNEKWIGKFTRAKLLASDGRSK